MTLFLLFLLSANVTSFAAKLPAHISPCTLTLGHDSGKPALAGGKVQIPGFERVFILLDGSNDAIDPSSLVSFSKQTAVKIMLNHAALSLSLKAVKFNLERFKKVLGEISRNFTVHPSYRASLNLRNSEKKLFLSEGDAPPLDITDQKLRDLNGWLDQYISTFETAKEICRTLIEYVDRFETVDSLVGQADFHPQVERLKQAIENLGIVRR